MLMLIRTEPAPQLRLLAYARYNCEQRLQLSPRLLSLLRLLLDRCRRNRHKATAPNRARLVRDPWLLDCDVAVAVVRCRYPRCRGRSVGAMMGTKASQQEGRKRRGGREKQTRMSCVQRKQRNRNGKEAKTKEQRRGGFVVVM